MASDYTYQRQPPSHSSSISVNGIPSIPSIAAATILRSIHAEEKRRDDDLRADPAGLFAKECSCEYDWMSAFCLRAEIYRQLDPIDAPTICICR